ncbi:MAG: nitroreductase family protein [Candidatus Omnitrophica bacterium]|nr:nitroreductase family protein [Candidatus Omnitrophota bacterium]MDD5429943.1 nitroreductase family protein [Candidatus Omnitrophota bacterium]
MNVFEAINKRKSVRDYKDKLVSDEDIFKVLEAARQAPSASNRQEWRFVVVKDENSRRGLSQAAKNQKFISSAPVVIACCAQTDYHCMSCGQLSYVIDVAIAIDYMTLAAVELGLGTCWVGAFYEDEVRRILNIPKNIRVVELLTLGYPGSGASGDRNRLGLKDIVFFEKWGAGF